MLGFKEAFSKLQTSKKFKECSNKAYLTSALFMENWQLNYFNPETKEITIFTIKNNITFNTQKEDRKFKKLNADIKFDLNEVLKIFQKQRSKYSEKTTKTIIILQQDSEPVWNISQLTSSLKIFNMKISALTGKILEESFKKLIEMT